MERAVREPTGAEQSAAAGALLIAAGVGILAGTALGMLLRRRSEPPRPAPVADADDQDDGLSPPRAALSERERRRLASIIARTS